MDCLHCGDCCNRMSPISFSEPCPNLVIDDSFYFCDSYHIRPPECEHHDFPSRFCPIGMDILGLSYPDDVEKIRVRLEIGYYKTKQIK